MFSLWSTAEHLLVLTTFLFPPLTGLVILVLCIALFGKSLGIRMWYIKTLIRVFEWGAGEITTRQNENLTAFQIGNDAEEGSDLEDDDQSHTHSHELLGLEIPEYRLGDAYNHFSHSIAHPNSPDSGMVDPPLAGSMSPTSSLRKSLSGSTTSLNSAPPTFNRIRHSSSQSNIIVRRSAVHLVDLDDPQYFTALEHDRGWKVIKDSVTYIKLGVESIIEDEVTSRFNAEQLASWNLLSRTSLSYQFLSSKLTILWFAGFTFRYCFLFPLRILFFGVGLIFLLMSSSVIGLVPNCFLKRWLNEKSMQLWMTIGANSFSAVIRTHDTQNKAKGGICVANHTSPIDVMILGTDNVYAMIGQRHSGFMGMFQRALSRGSSHIWFERTEARDRAGVSERLRKHIQDPNKLPVLIFPEGTCINNSAVMMFKKGCFEIATKVYPIAMKYDPRFGDAFWNSSEQGYVEYMFRMMTSWALICDVWYLPPMDRLPNESAVDFANRVRRAIAECGGLIDLEWDGALKRSKVSPRMVDEQRERYSRHLLHAETEINKHDDNELRESITPNAAEEELPEGCCQQDLKTVDVGDRN